MTTATFNIRFEFLMDAARLNIILEADIREHHSDTYYVVNNFRIPGQSHRQVLPEISIRKQNGVWVHTDSGKATDLSIAVGKAIDARGPGGKPSVEIDDNDEIGPGHALRI
jgi:hypothetical protein